MKFVVEIGEFANEGGEPATAAIYSITEGEKHRGCGTNN